MHRTDSSGGGWRLPARELEAAVAQTLSDFLKDKLRVADSLQLSGNAPDRLRTILGRAAAAARDLDDGQPERHRQLLRLLLHCVTLQAASMRIEIKRSGLRSFVAGSDSGNLAHPDGLIDVAVPIEPRRRGVEAKLVVRAGEVTAAVPDPILITLIARAHRWFHKLRAGEIGSDLDLAERDGIDTSDVGRDIQLAFLAPDIVDAILAGRQPVALTARRLRHIGALPPSGSANVASLAFLTDQHLRCS